MNVRGRAGAFAALAVVLLARAARGQSQEPPVDVPAGVDYESEIEDSLALGQVEWTLGATGRAGGGVLRRRRLRVESDSLSASLREGDSDPLAGGALEGRSLRGAFGIGRLAPHWGRGLVLGTPADPWTSPTAARGGRARGTRGAEGAWLQAGGRTGIELLAGRFAKRPLGGVAVRHGGLAAGALVAEDGAHQWSLVSAVRRAALEMALDQRGRWRGELGFSRGLGWATVGARVRGGSPGFRSLSEPARGGPPVLLAAGLSAPSPTFSAHVWGAVWRHGPGAPGARAVIELRRRFDERADLELGLEERHGAQRPPRTVGSSEGYAQGWWGEWSAGTAALRLAIRHEAWGARSLARAPVRVATTGRVETVTIARVTVRVTQTVHRSRSGESLYLPERGSDRLVLRALAGSGERTRVELAAPVAGGTLGAGAGFGTTGRRAASTQWTLEWTRRARLRR